MSVNKYTPHVYVIPEDDADRQIAVGFVLHDRVQSRRVQVVEPAGGWPKVLDSFKTEYLPLLQNQNTHVVMLIDFDGTPVERRARFNAEIPVEVRDRVFVIGPLMEPEGLKNALDKADLEDIGWHLANDCDGDRLETWGHVQLLHNEDERLRLVRNCKAIPLQVTDDHRFGER